MNIKLMLFGPLKKKKTPKAPKLTAVVFDKAKLLLLLLLRATL